MCDMNLIAINLGHMWCTFSLFFICCYVRCISGIYIFHYNPNLNPSVSFHGQVLHTNDGSFSYL